MSEAGSAQQGGGPIAALPLLGFTVAVTADRRHRELAALLQRRGARVVSAPTIHTVPLDDERLLTATRIVLAEPVDITIVTTGVGLRGWLEAADGWGVGDDVRAALAASEVVVRGPKARGATRAAGLRDAWMPVSEAMEELVDHLVEQGVRGRRIALQLHGDPLESTIDRLRAAGARVTPVPVYRWTLPDDVGPARRLVGLAVGRQVDAVTFTSAPAISGLLDVARADGREQALLASLRDGVLPVCIGPVCAMPLERRDVAAVRPARGRLGDLVRVVTEELPSRKATLVRAGGHDIEVRGHLAVVDGTPVALPPAPMAVLRALATRPGKVHGRATLAAVLPGERVGPHAVEMAVTRLRSLLGDPKVVKTVMKRGYQLAADPG